MTKKDNFEERLLTELRQVAAERPEPAKTRSAWRPTAVALGGGGVAVAVAAVAIVAGGGSSPSNAYAVETHPDGEVTVKIKSLKDAEGLETKLLEAGVPAEVNYAPAMTIECVTPTEMPEGIAVSKDGKTLDIQKVPAEPVRAAAETVPSEAAIPAEPVPGRKGEIPLAEGPGGEKPVAVAPTRAIPVSDERTFTIDPREIEEGAKLFVTKPTRAGAAGVAATIGAPGEAPDC